MATMKTQNAPAKTASKTSQEKALDAFCHHLASARELTTLIARHLGDHMEVAPDEVNWANAGDASRIHEALKEIAATFKLI
jgi:hypothetical protein